ncbi:MAG: prepilin-type N-terminal cleavage/methylation domain-containing protein [Candidatus Omnitrophica bacterium]|nr:prepilin-type N-terminal cleavage/methylation domain-containing protein [Candidatus Omnitrophota bacterium]
MFAQKMFAQRAFSLFELVVSLALLVILLVALSTIFTAGMGIYRHHDRGLFPYKEVRNIFTLIESDLSSVVPSIVGGTPSELFQGNVDRCRFITIDPTTHDTLGIRYFYNPDAHTLERHSTITDSSTLPIDFTNIDIIGESIAAFSITYYSGHFSGLHLTTSRTTWPSIAPIDAARSEMPKAIAISLTIIDPLYPDIQENFTRLFTIESR